MRKREIRQSERSKEVEIMDFMTDMAMFLKVKLLTIFGQNQTVHGNIETMKILSLRDIQSVFLKSKIPSESQKIFLQVISW